MDAFFSLSGDKLMILKIDTEILGKRPLELLSRTNLLSDWGNRSGVCLLCPRRRHPLFSAFGFVRLEREMHMLHAKNRTLVTTLATLSLMGMPVLAYADPAGGETPRNDAEMASPAPEAITTAPEEAPSLPTAEARKPRARIARHQPW